MYVFDTKEELVRDLRRQRDHEFGRQRRYQALANKYDRRETLSRDEANNVLRDVRLADGITSVRATAQSAGARAAAFEQAAMMAEGLK